MAKAKQKRGGKHEVAKLDRDMMDLAGMLVHATRKTETVDLIAEKMRVTRMTVYNWLEGKPISASEAFRLVTRMKGRVADLGNERDVARAKRLLKVVGADLAFRF